MEVGTVKWFNDKRGYGFITREGEPDLFLHITNIQEGEHLKEGDKVRFEISATAKGLAAVDVRKV